MSLEPVRVWTIRRVSTGHTQVIGRRAVANKLHKESGLPLALCFKDIDNLERGARVLYFHDREYRYDFWENID